VEAGLESLYNMMHIWIFMYVGMFIVDSYSPILLYINSTKQQYNIYDT
jgi:hypothetical protein